MSFDRPKKARLFALISLVLLVLGVSGGCRDRKTIPTSDMEESSSSDPLQSKEKELAATHNTEVRFPRRLLFISISRYDSLNPLTIAETGKSDQTKAAALRLAQSLKVPTQKDNQVYLLSDTAPPPDNTLPIRDAVVGAYERFFNTSKPQDRIIVYFGGHVLEVDGKAFIAPIEGKKNDAKTLIPLKDFYGKLKDCKAAQKVVIWDVCRFNPDRGRSRPGSEMMTPSLYKSLTTVPDGVEVIVTCTAGEHALEFTNLQIDLNASKYSGSAFLEAIKYAVEKNRLVGTVQNPGDPIPVEEWVAVLGKRVTEVAATPDVGMKQTIRYVANREKKAETTKATPEPPPLAKNNNAEIQAIVDEIRLTPLKSSRPPLVLSEYPYRDDVIAAYKSDVSLEEIKKNKKKYEFRNVTLNAYQTLRDVFEPKPKPKVKGKEKATDDLVQRDSIGTVTNDLKNNIKKELAVWASGIAKLEEVNRSLEEVSSQKKNQPRRWQAHYDYARATVKFRLAFMNEYDKLMGDVLTETLPPLDKSLNQSGYRLVSSEKMKSKKDIQKLAEEALEAFDALIAEYKDTPWAIQAKYDKGFTLGLVWQPGK